MRWAATLVGSPLQGQCLLTVRIPPSGAPEPRVRRCGSIPGRRGTLRRHPGPRGLPRRMLPCSLNPLSGLKKIRRLAITATDGARSGCWHMGCIIEVTGDFVCKCGLNF